MLLAGAAVAVAVVLFFVFRGGDDDPKTASATATPTATASAQADVVTQVALQGKGNKSAGLMQVYKRDAGGLVFALAAEKLPANKQREVYAVWFTGKGVKPRLLGYAQAQVGKEGTLQTGGPQQGQETQFAKWLTDYDKIVLARASADSANAKRRSRSCSRARSPAPRTSRDPYAAASCRACRTTSTCCATARSGACSAPPAISWFGDRMVSVALAFAVIGIGGSASDIGLVLAARSAALVASLLLGGVVADRVSRRAVMVWADLSRAGHAGRARRTGDRGLGRRLDDRAARRA